MRAGIVGVGLIGGSLGLAWRRRGAVDEVVGVGRDLERLERARRAGAIDRCATELEALADADVVVLATPIGVALEVAPAVARCARQAALVTDVGSAKVAICRRYADLGLPFVGGHPLAGSERAGIEAADPYLFENAVWVLTRTDATTDGAGQLAADLAAATGAHPVWLDATRHDEWVARVSHTPQLVAVALVQAAAEDEGALSLGGGGFRDTTRIASSPPDFWLDVFATNRAPLLAALERFGARLDALRQALAAGDGATLASTFRQAAQARARMPQRTKGLLPSYHDLVLTIPDRPGVIGRLATALGDRGVNIQDIEILRLREGEGGSLRLGFARAEEADQAQAVLAEIGIEVQRR